MSELTISFVMKLSVHPKVTTMEYHTRNVQGRLFDGDFLPSRHYFGLILCQLLFAWY